MMPATSPFGQPPQDARVSWLVAVEVAKVYTQLKQDAELKHANLEIQLEALRKRVAKLEPAAAAREPPAVHKKVPLFTGQRFRLEDTPRITLVIDDADRVLWKMGFVRDGVRLDEVPSDIAVNIAGGLGPATRVPGGFVLSRTHSYELVQGSTTVLFAAAP